MANAKRKQRVKTIQRRVASTSALAAMIDTRRATIPPGQPAPPTPKAALAETAAGQAKIGQPLGGFASAAVSRPEFGLKQDGAGGSGLRGNGIAALVSIREKTHGAFANHARYSQGLKKVARQADKWAFLADVQAEAIEMILDKIARILAGDPRHPDHWADIGGYADLGGGRG